MPSRSDQRRSDPPAPAARTVAFLDMGTNSTRLLVVRIESDGSYAVLTQQRESIRLGEGEFATYHIQPEAMARAVLVTTRFAAMARSFGAAQIVAVATSAAREASNQHELLHRLREASGVDVRVISGPEEARLIYLGVISGARLDGQTALIIDVGGGSTEMVVGDRRHHRHLESVRLGAIRLTNMFFDADFRGPVSPSRYARIQQFVRTSVVRSMQRLADLSFDQVLGASGTIVALGDVAARRFLGRPREKSDCFSHDQLKLVIADLCRLPLAKRQKVPGLSANRADLIVAGAAIVDTLLEELGGPPLVVSDRALRDGLLVDYLRRSGHAVGMAGLSNREQSVLRLGRRCRFDEGHARHVAHLATELFDSARAARLHRLGEPQRELLVHAALLHDVGTFLSYANHRAHSYYIIRNADLLGFDDTEIAIVATTALYHKKTYPRKVDAEFAALDRRAQATVRRLCVLLRMAESLDRSHGAAVSHARLGSAKAGGPVPLELEANHDCHLELWALQAHANAFIRAFGVPFHVAVPAAPATPLAGRARDEAVAVEPRRRTGRRRRQLVQRTPTT